MYITAPYRFLVQIFGAVCSGPLRMSESFYGTGESFLYKFEDKDELKVKLTTGGSSIIIHIDLSIWEIRTRLKFGTGFLNLTQPEIFQNRGQNK